MVILYLRFGAKALQDSFVAELSTHYQNYILSKTYWISTVISLKCENEWWCHKCVGTYSLAPDVPAEFLSFYGLLNFYLYTLAFVYSPSKNALYGR